MFVGKIVTQKQRLRAWLDSVFVDHAIFRLVWTNFSPVIPGQIYRCNHPTPARLKRLQKRLGILTLVNLRGHRQCGSDALSREATENLGLKHIDMAFESRGAPHRDRIQKFYKIYQTLQKPALMHCKSGADRAGLASGLIILFEGGTAHEALRQLNWRYGHFQRSRTGILDAFFRLYQNEGEGRFPFMDWVDNHYDEAGLRASFKARGFSTFITDRLLRRE